MCVLDQTVSASGAACLDLLLHHIYNVPYVTTIIKFTLIPKINQDHTGENKKNVLLIQSKRNPGPGAPVVAQWVKNLTRGCKFQPWPCSEG